MSRVIYVQGSKLKFPTQTSLDDGGEIPKQPDNKKQGLVDSGSIVIFTDKVKGQQKNDVLNACLFAQFAANAAGDREKETEKWYHKYREALENIGFVIHSFSFDKYSTTRSTLKMDAVVLEILSSIITDTEILSVAEDVIGSLKDKANGDALTLFSSNSSEGSGGNFQVMTCSADSTGQVILPMGAFYFSASQEQADYFFFEWSSSDMHLYKGTEVLVLDEEVYSQVREEIIKRLGSHAKHYVIEEKLKPSSAK